MTVTEFDLGADLAAGEEPVECEFDDVGEFVEGFVNPTYIRDVASVRWCPWWWRHQEAAVRFTALWRAYEQARTSDDPGAMAAYLRLELDHHMAVLTSETGPFRKCLPNRHAQQTPARLEPVPDGLFDTDNSEER